MWSILSLFIIVPTMALNYDFNPQMTYSSNTLESGKYQLKIHRWESKNNQKWAMLTHGLLDHCLYLKPIMNFLIEHQYNILCYDLPGHGASSGEPVDIDQFKSYKNAHHDVLSLLPESKDSLFLGHSTGNVGLLQSLIENQGKTQFEKIVMVAPLTRSYLWQLYGWAITQKSTKALKKIPIVMRSDHPDYKELVANDPYRRKSLPTNWLLQLHLWFQEIKDQPVTNSSHFHVLFGDRDTVVDHRFGKNFFETSFPDSKVHILPKTKHMPHYDKEKPRDSFFELLDKLI